ncbi:MAG: type II toxin-antitoxin system VapC family toxin [Chloroflexota bacterium]|nr:type II toxin-antitoxin system VapC family toxin [Chloroflexota bacterium]
MASLAASGVELREPERLHELAMSLAQQTRQSAVYGSHYLALAEVLDCDFWTADLRLYRSARTSASRIRWIGEFTA